jgi:hypothetical protein
MLKFDFDRSFTQGLRGDAANDRPCWNVLRDDRAGGHDGPFTNPDPRQNRHSACNPGIVANDYRTRSATMGVRMRIVFECVNMDVRGDVDVVPDPEVRTAAIQNAKRIDDAVVTDGNPEAPKTYMHQDRRVVADGDRLSIEEKAYGVERNLCHERVEKIEGEVVRKRS